MDRLAQEIEELTEVVAKQKADLTRYKIYQKFMERVLDKSDEVQVHDCEILQIMKPSRIFKSTQFDEAHEIIARYDTLKHTREVRNKL